MTIDANAKAYMQKPQLFFVSGKKTETLIFIQLLDAFMRKTRKSGKVHRIVHATFKIIINFHSDSSNQLNVKKKYID